MTSSTFRIHISTLAVIIALSLPLSTALAGASTAHGADTDSSESFKKGSAEDALAAPSTSSEANEQAETSTSTGSTGGSPAPSADMQASPSNPASSPQEITTEANNNPSGSNDQEPHWTTTLETGNKTLLTLIQSVSGKPNNDETTTLLTGVVKISHQNDVFTFHRENGDQLTCGPSTALGDKLRSELTRAKSDVERYGSPILSKTISDFHGVEVNGQHVDILRDGPEELTLRIPKKARKKLPVKVKEVRLGRMSLELDESKGYPAIRNISGVEVVVWLGIELHITPKEFWRTQNERGDTTLTVGILNPLPKALRMAFGLKEISYFSHTVRKKQERVSSVLLPESR